MQKIKDILYDTNDLIVALAIIVLAALLIWDRIGVILEYPGANAGAGDAVYQDDGGVLTGGNGEEENDADATTEGPEGADGGGAVTPADDADADGGTRTETPVETPAETDPVEPTRYSLYIAYGETAKQIAQKLLDSGLVKDENEFYDALIEADAATRLQAGSFIITEGVTPAEIVDILTGR